MDQTSDKEKTGNVSRDDLQTTKTKRWKNTKQVKMSSWSSERNSHTHTPGKKHI